MQPLAYWFLSGRFLPWGLRWNQRKVGHSSMWIPVCGICNLLAWWQDNATVAEKFVILWDIRPYNMVDFTDVSSNYLSPSSGLKSKRDKETNKLLLLSQFTLRSSIEDRMFLQNVYQTRRCNVTKDTLFILNVLRAFYITFHE
jgi:hypothetical protein